MLPRIELVSGLRSYDFHEGNSSSLVYTPHDGSIVARWQISDDCRLPWMPRSVAAVPDLAHLIARG